MKIHNLFIFTFLLIFNACEKADKEKKHQKKQQEKKTRFTSSIKMLSDEKYPDNPAIGHRSDQYNKIEYDSIAFIRKSDYKFDIRIWNKETGNELLFNKVNLYEFIPGIPDWIKKDSNLTNLTLLSQERNRQQVYFKRDLSKVQIKADSFQKQHARQFDIARNSLNAYLWELVFYSDKTGKILPYFHGWFDFPKELYQDLFVLKNNILFLKFKDILEKGKKPSDQSINLKHLRTIIDSKEIDALAKNHEFYPLKGPFKRKFKNIIKPEDPDNMNAFINDSTTFASFIKPGIYSKKHPHSTQLSRFSILESVVMRKTRSYDTSQKIFTEFEFTFSNAKEKNKLTTWIIGGIDLKKIPHISVNNINKAWKMPMGIANNPFYENYQNMTNKTHMQSPYFSFLLNSQGMWVNSNKVGIDGPLMFFDKKHPKNLHVYVLSYKRHALVSHFILDTSVNLNKEKL